MEDTKDFKQHEFVCKCGCGLNSISQTTVDMLQLARDWKDILFHECPSIRINCGTRCYHHNIGVGGVKNSSHVPRTQGGETFAVDIDYDDTLELIALIASLSIAGFKRFGISLDKKYIHTDNDISKPYDIWTY